MIQAVGALGRLFQSPKRPWFMSYLISFSSGCQAERVRGLKGHPQAATPVTFMFSQFQAVPKIFSSGLDITEMCGKSTEHYGEFWRAVQEMWLRLYSSNMVTIAAVNVCPLDPPSQSCRTGCHLL